MTILTKELLIKFGACEEGISFCESNKLFGFELSRIDEIKGDFNNFVLWLRYQNNIKRKYNSHKNLIYKETSDGNWTNWEYDSNGNLIYEEDSNGNCIKWEYDFHGNKIYQENSNGNWWKYQYDSNGNILYEEHYTGYWKKIEYDSNGNKIKEKNSNGYIKSYEIEYYSTGQLKRYGGLYLPLV